MRELYIVGLTGQSGAGKSTVSNFLKNNHIAVIDCDRLSREVTLPDSACLNKLAELFSAEILTDSGELNRKELGKIVFSDKAALKRLNETIFPYIMELIDCRIASLKVQNEKIVVLDAPTLFESGADRMCSLIIAVTAPEDVRKERIKKRDQLSDAEAQSRMDSQKSEQFFQSHAHIIIENKGKRKELDHELLHVVKIIKERAEQWSLTPDV